MDKLLAQALRGTTVVEVAGGLAGQHCGYSLAGVGARVLTVRAPGAPTQPLDAIKQVVALDPYAPASFEALARLCADAALFIEERPPLGWPTGGPLYARLQQRHPHLLALCLTPFGLTGPYADYAAYPLNCYHAGGNAQQIPCDFLRPQDRERAPLQAGGQWGEAQAGTLAAVAALACLRRPQDYAGRVIDCSRQEALISFNWTEVARFPNEGRAPTRLAPLATIVGGILPTQDGHVQVAAREDHQWAALAQLLDHPEWADDARWATRAARTSRGPEISRLLAAQTVKYSSAHLHLRGRELGIPIAAVMSPAQLLADADLAARGAWDRVAAAGSKYPGWATHVRTAPASDAATQPADAAPATAATIERPLQGLRVLDFGWVAMGPYAGYTLAALGAEVIHVARPTSQIGGGVDLTSYNYGFDTLNTGKRWIGLDLKSPEGLALIHGLVAQCDLVLENFRPGVTRRLGIDFDTLAKINPRLVMLSASTYGERGIGGAYVGYAPVFSALAGLAHFTGYPDGPPAEVSHPVDFYAGSVGILGLLAGLHRLAASGRGCHIDLSAREAILWSLTHELVRLQSGQFDGRRLGNGHPEMAPHGVYRCRGENRWISIAVGSDEEWQRLCACVRDEALSSDARFLTAPGRLAHSQALDARLERWTQERELGEVFQTLQASKVAAFPSCTSEDLWNDAHIQARGIFMKRQAGAATRWYVGAPWHYLGQPRAPLNTLQGQEASDAVWGRLLGLSEERMQALITQGVMALR